MGLGRVRQQTAEHGEKSVNTGQNRTAFAALMTCRVAAAPCRMAAGQLSHATQGGATPVKDLTMSVAAAGRREVSATQARLRMCSVYVLIWRMSRFDPETIANAILTAPGWARVGITAPAERLREEAAQELAAVILTAESAAPAEVPDDQIELAL